jgi:uncharacterized membrane-anchored protein YitT (DUF2179 family)
MPHGGIRAAVRDTALIVVGSFVYAVGIDCFEIPNGLAAGGLTGVATITSAIASNAGITLHVGIQTIAMNAVLLGYVYATTHDGGYVTQSIFGMIVSGLFTDLLAPVLPVPVHNDLLLSAIWGGVIAGAGIGIVFLSGGNTGGTDIVCQLIARRTGMPLGTLAIIVDGAIVAASIPVFSLTNALYAGVAMYISGRVIDAIVDGPLTARVAFVISSEHDRIGNQILYTLGRGCTELQARGLWSGSNRPVLMCVLGRTETHRLKEIVAGIDPDAVVIVTEVHEAFGEGFTQIGSGS